MGRLSETRGEFVRDTRSRSDTFDSHLCYLSEPIRLKLKREGEGHAGVTGVKWTRWGCIEKDASDFETVSTDRAIDIKPLLQNS